MCDYYVFHLIIQGRLNHLIVIEYFQSLTPTTSHMCRDALLTIIKTLNNNFKTFS